VSVSLRNWFEWREYDLEFSNWIYLALSSESPMEWLPEWNSLPHVVVEFGPNPFDVPTGGGLAGSSGI
jgi:hypothetical protein